MTACVWKFCENAERPRWGGTFTVDYDKGAALEDIELLASLPQGWRMREFYTPD